MTHTVSYQAFTAKDPGETVTLSFDFVNLTSAPLTPTVSITRIGGVADASPSSVLLGAPEVSGTKVLQAVTLGVDLTDYLLRCEVDTSGQDHFILSGILPVRAA